MRLRCRRVEKMRRKELDSLMSRSERFTQEYLSVSDLRRAMLDINFSV